MIATYTQTPARLQLGSLLVSLVIFAAAQLFFLILIVSSYQDYRAQTYASLIEVNTSYTADKLSVVASFGRSVETYRGASDDLYNLKILSRTKDAFLTDPAGRIILGSSVSGLKTLPPELLRAGSGELNGVPYRFAPFHHRSGAVLGYVAAATEYSDSYAASIQEPGSSFYLYPLLTFIISAAGFVLYWKRRQRQRTAPPKTFAGKAKAFALFMLPFFFGQLLTCAAAAPQMTRLIADYSASLEQTLSASVSRSFDEIRRHDISLSDISGYEEYFAQLKQSLPVIGGISLKSAAGELIAGDQLPAGEGSELPLFAASGLLGVIQVAVSSSVMLDLFLDMGLKLITLLIISSVLAFELSSLLDFELRRMERYKGEAQKAPFEAGLIRPLSFLFVLALYIPITVVPVHMGSFAADFPALDPALLRSLAVICEMAFIALSSFYILFSKPYPGRWKRLGILSLSLLTAAAFTAASAGSGYQFLLSRALYGLGYGMLLASCQLCVIGNVSKEERGAGMSALSAGLYSGVLCAAATGGIIADNLGIKAAFIASGILFAVNLVLYLYLLSSRAAQNSSASAEQDAASAKHFSVRAVFLLLKDPQTLSLLACQALPYSIIGIGFFNFLLPVTAADHHYGAAAVGQLNFIYALIIILCAPLTGRLIDKARSKGYLLLSLSLVASALVPLLFLLPSFIAAAAGAMICLGISAAVNESGQPAVLSRFDKPQQVGADTSVMLLDSMLRIGQTLGPLLVALLLTAGGSGSFVYLSAAVLLLAAVFCLVQTMVLKRRSAAGAAAAA